MTIQGYNFIYAEQSSDLFGVIKCDIETINEDSNDEESELVTSTTPYKRTYSLHSVEKSAPLKFKLTICKKEGGFMDADKEEILKEWLCQEEYHWLSFEQDDLCGKLYYCVITNPQKVNVARMTGGMQFDVTCDHNGAWTKLDKKSYTTTNGTLTFSFNNYAKLKKFNLCPTLIVKPTTSGNISIKNNTTDQIVTINNCVTTEVITLDCENEIVESSNGRILVNDWNLEFLEMKKGNNSVTLTGNFSMEMRFRFPVRIGG